jgi:hypothetical protein
MINAFLRTSPNKIAVQQFQHEEQALALLRIQGGLRSRILEQFS